ncbi:IclR family transcriptional regulator [Inquilinus limosus]|uniref:IclR family transcriptional regulator n=1 Tax=Inquilinus limosus TaxID=171674 RepID=UPI00042A9342|nr:IclR family transcriptional regulator [Inquilinus limosus]
MNSDVNADDRDAAAKPGAPALEKGLDLLEALAAEPGGITQKRLAERVGRSVGEIFRMLGVLERRGYVVRDPKTGEYRLTLRLFQLGTQHPPTRRLQQAALPIMERLAASVGLACHLSMASGEHFLIVAQAEPDRPMGWTVKLGAVFPLSMHLVSARILTAFQREPRRGEMVRIMAQRDVLPVDDVLARLEGIAAAGFDMAPSETAPGLTDISAPVLDPSGLAVAALTLPFLPQRGDPTSPEEALAALRDAAARITEQIGGPVD